jgi:hypothetical protein
MSAVRAMLMSPMTRAGAATLEHLVEVGSGRWSSNQGPAATSVEGNGSSVGRLPLGRIQGELIARG